MPDSFNIFDGRMKYFTFYHISEIMYVALYFMNHDTYAKQKSNIMHYVNQYCDVVVGFNI